MAHKIAIIIGTRPEVIKMAPVYLAMKSSTALTPILVSTGQHREMLDQACAVFGLHPDADLRLMQAGQDLPSLTARVIQAVSALLSDIKPAAILVQGDTTTVLGASLAAFYQHIPIGHVEAGLRTYNLQSPWPEEMNRRLADPISRWCFAPTISCKDNLLSERVPPENIFVTGNTVIDALLWVKKSIEPKGGFAEDFVRKHAIGEQFASRFLRGTETSGRLILVTGHRRESFGKGFECICTAIRTLVDQFPDVGVIYPVHLNPNVQEPVRRALGNHERIQLIAPTDYESFVWLMRRAYFILSDSGGVQEEAPSLGKPVLVMRDTTERPEGISVGTSRLTGTDPQRILHECSILLNDQRDYSARSALKNPYGDGQASARIVAVLENFFL